MRKTICTVLAMTIIGIMGSGVMADSTSIVDYVNEHEITSREEFYELVGEEIVDDVDDTYTEVSFVITVDDDNDYIVLDTIYETPETRGTKTGSVSHDVFSNTGKLIYTITATGTFSYTTGSCSVTSKSGSFSYPAGSLWRSTPTVSSGHVTASKAYVKVSGTATCVGFANKTYELYLYCNSNGYLSSSFTGT